MRTAGSVILVAAQKLYNMHCTCFNSKQVNSSEEEKDSNVTSTTLGKFQFVHLYHTVFTTVCKFLESCDHALIMNNNITIINRTSMTLAFMCKEGFVSTNNTKEFVAMCTDNNSWSPDPTEYNYCVPQSSSTTGSSIG